MDTLLFATVYALPVAAGTLAYGAVRRRAWTLPALAALLASCVAVVVLRLATEDAALGGGTVWEGGDERLRPWLVGLAVVAAGGAAAAAVRARRPASRAELLGGVAAGSAVGGALLVVAVAYGLH
jgi:hypothetical protein